MGSMISALAGGVVLTLSVSAASWVLATCLGLILACLRELPIPVVPRLVRIFVNVARSLPELLVLYLFYFGLGGIGISLSPFIAATLAIGIGESGFTSEIFRAGMMNIPAGQREAGSTVGLGSVGVLRHVVLPQIIPYVIPPMVNSYAALLKVATLASAIGVDEVLERANLLIADNGSATRTLLTVAAIYLILTIPLSKAAGYLERRMRRRVQGYQAG
jgi:polar amino acid transport system permease protein